MKIRLIFSNFNYLPFVVLILFVISCANSNNKGNQGVVLPSPTNSAQVSSNLNSATNSPPAMALGFATNNICSLPKQVAANTPYANLGGGNWGKWGDFSGELDYGCNGGKDSFKIKDDGNTEITIEYGVIGGSQTAHYISAEYTAMQYAGQTPDEKQLRQQYADFCDKLSMNLYGSKLPTKFRKRLLDESSYSASGTANEYAEKIGSGYVNLSSNKNNAMMILLDVHFFSSEAEYKKYKDD